ncbi:pickpocket protein 19-like [Leptopilina heterotoma]|uniref:pickpocket protein 19-like n=1 Tax=Leptopilina heterotoma TaxID=63436 RepID=UPI001CA97752|nr:pickpocket protein 19-like [Leptopilina heterotoma]
MQRTNIKGTNFPRELKKRIKLVNWIKKKNSKIPPRVKKAIKKVDSKEKFINKECLSKFIAYRCSLHGVRYIFDHELHTVDRIIWFIFLSIFIYFTTQEMSTIIFEYQAAPTKVVIDSSSYRVAFVPFPSVTICPKKRVDWTKALELEKEIIPTNNSQTIILYRRLMNILSSSVFGNLVEMRHLQGVDIASSELANFNITDILYRTVPDCKSLFSDCSWNRRNESCCDIFHLQKTLYGFCYSFNSARSEKDEYNKQFVPNKTAGYGSKSGLKFTFQLGKIKFPPDINHDIQHKYVLANDDEEYRRIILLIHGTQSWPNWGQEIMTGFSLNGRIQCSSQFATREVLDLDSSKIPCRRNKFTTRRKYSLDTCIAECKQMHAIKYCACNPSYYFPPNTTRDCELRDLHCLYGNTYRFKDYQMPGDADYDERNYDIMHCDCPSPCSYTYYDTKFNVIPIESKDDIKIDIHHVGPTSIRYKRKVVFNRLYLLVYVGGIFGLFVGGSIISVLELIHIFIIGVLRRYHRKTKKIEKLEINKKFTEMTSLFVTKC